MDSGSLHIHDTVAVASHVLYALSLNVNLNIQFPVNVYVLDQPLFVMIIQLSDNHVNVATTSQLKHVHCHGL